MLLSMIFALTAQAQQLPRPAKLANCEYMVAVYNRCEPHVILHADENRIELPTLKKSVTCDDGLELPFLQRLKNADVASMLTQIYVPGPTELPVRQENFSPGGIRNQDFMLGTYGADHDHVEANLATINFLNQQVRFNKNNGAAKALERVGKELSELYRKNADKQLTKYLKPFMTQKPEGRLNLPGTTFVWRLVAGTKTLSNHSFGTAIDLQPASGTQYWLWDLQSFEKSGKAQWSPGSDHTDLHNITNFEPKANADYPQKMVEVFEKHGFIWGGKWYRYDVMHFEFRPEFFDDIPCD